MCFCTGHWLVVCIDLQHWLVQLSYPSLNEQLDNALLGAQ